MGEEEATIQNDKRDSIELSCNAKGEHAWKAKRYYDAESQKFEDIIDELVNIDNLLKEKFG